MADQRDILNGLKHQLSAFVANEVLILNAGSGVSTGDDLRESVVYNVDPFDEEDPAEYTKLSFSDSASYCFVITGSEIAQTPSFPVGYLREQFTCKVVVIRKTAISHDYTNDYNLVLFGGDNGAGEDITSIAKLTGDMKKWFRNHTLGGRLNDGTNDNCFKADITSVSELRNVKKDDKKTSFFYVVCEFESLSMESTTITAS